MSQKEQGIYEFHQFQLDIGKGILLREGQPVSMQWKTFELLCALVKSNGNLITRDELMNELWADTFVEDNNLSQHIRALRKALGENGNGNAIIETIPRRGYRFLPEVRTVEVVNENKLELSNKTQSLIDAEAVLQTNSFKSLAIAHPTVVSQIPLNENDAAIVPIDIPQMRQKSLSWLKLLAIITVVTVFIAGIIVWSNWNKPDDRHLLYGNQIKLAAYAWETSNLPLMKEQLDSSAPKKDEEDLRGFEWYYLSRLYAENTSSQFLLLEHNAGLGGIAFSPDGKTLATGCADHKARIWNVATGQQLVTFKGHADRIDEVAFSPDGKILATGSFDKTVKLWEAATGQELFTLNTEYDSGIRFSPDGRALAVGNSKTTRFWDVATGKEIPDFLKISQENFLLMGLSPDGKVFAARGNDQSIKIWEIATGRNIATFKGHADLVVDAKFSPDGKTFATGSWDGTAKIWDIKTGLELHTLKGHTGRIYDIAFSPDGKVLATGGTADFTIKLWNTATGREFTSFKGHVSEISALAFSPDGRKLASGGNDKTVRVWNIPQNEINDLLEGHTELIKAMVFSPDGKSLATASNDQTVKLWDVAKGQAIRTLKGHADLVNAAAFSPDGRILATGGDDKLLKLWDIATGRELLTIKSASDISTVAFSPDGKTVATSYWQDHPVIELWKVADGQLVGILNGHTGWVWSVVFSPDGKQLVTAGDDHTARLWDIATRQEISIFNGNTKANYAADFSPEGQMLVLEQTNKDRTLRLFDAPTKRELAAFKGNSDEVTSFAFSPDGKRLVTGSWNDTVRIWDVITGQELLKLKGGSGIAFASDGNTIATASGNTARLWRTSTSKE